MPNFYGVSLKKYACKMESKRINTCLLCLYSESESNGGTKKRRYFIASKQGQCLKLLGKCVFVLGIDEKVIGTITKECICQNCFRKVESFEKFKVQCLSSISRRYETDSYSSNENASESERSLSKLQHRVNSSVWLNEAYHLASIRN